MSSIIKTILVILADAAVLVYTIMNYLAGKTTQVHFFVMLALLSYILVSMTAQLFRELRK